jgi:dihydrofolate synthase/folylpolyglutamate synthase
MTREGLPHPTPFEIETAAAFLYFQEASCDLVLLEVGMGGDMDATNVIKNTALAVLVSISIDHQAFLGNTLEEIAAKKAGIIKQGCHVVSTLQKPGAAQVIARAAAEKGVPLTVADYRKAVSTRESMEGQTFSYEGETYTISLLGVCQIENAVTALEALRELESIGYPTTLVQRKAGLLKTCWRGRFTVLHRDPLFIVDGAHNPGAADVLARSIETYLKGRRILYIMGMFKDKDYPYVVSKTCPYASEIWTIETENNPRALPAEALAEEIRRHGKAATPMKEIREAVNAAFEHAGKDDVILAFGSLSFLGKITEILEEKENELTGMPQSDR